MRQRYYNPEIKRFVNQDILTGSLDNSQSLNQYSYVQGNPVSYTDPFGLSPVNGLFSNSNNIHGALTLAGFTPGLMGGLADLTDAFIYLLEGDIGGAIGASIAIIAGGAGLAYKAAKGAKVARAVHKLSNTGEVINDVTRALDNGSDFMKASMTGADAAQTIKAAKQGRVVDKLKDAVSGVRKSSGKAYQSGSGSKGLIDGAPEPEVQNFIERFKERYPGREYKSGHKLQHSDGRNNIEIDFETDNAILEFKRGNGKGLTRQIIDRQDPMVNPNGKVVIGVPGSKMSRFAQQDVENAGGLMSNDIDLVLELIKPD